MSEQPASESIPEAPPASASFRARTAATAPRAPRVLTALMLAEMSLLTLYLVVESLDLRFPWGHLALAAIVIMADFGCLAMHRWSLLTRVVVSSIIQVVAAFVLVSLWGRLGPGSTETLTAMALLVFNGAVIAACSVALFRLRRVRARPRARRT